MSNTITMSPETLSGRATLRVFRDPAELDEIREAWETLRGDRDSDRTVYLSILHSRPHVLRPHILVAYRDGQPQSMLVGRLIDEPLAFRIGYAPFRMKARTLYFVYGGPRGADSEEYSELFVREICNSLAAGEADAVYLNFLRTDAALFQAARTIPPKQQQGHAGAEQLHFSSTLPPSSEAFYASLSSHTRRNVRNKNRKLEKTWPSAVRIRLCQTAEDVDVLAETAEVIMQTSYQRGLGVGFRDSAESRDQLRRRAERGWLRGYILYLADNPVAFWIGDVNHQTFRSDYTGYKSDYSNISPGMYLMLKTIEQFCDDPARIVTEIDLAVGYAEYKEMLGNRKWNESAVYLFAPSFRGKSLRTVHGIATRVNASLKRMLERLGLLKKIKKRWRRGVTGKTGAAESPAENTAAATENG